MGLFVAKPIPDYVARLRAMVPHERIVISGEYKLSAMRYHARAVNPMFRAKRIEGGVLIELKAPLTHKQRQKNAKTRLRLGSPHSGGQLTAGQSDKLWADYDTYAPSEGPEERVILPFDSDWET